MSTTSSTTVDVFKTIFSSVAYDLAYFTPVLLLFAFLFGMFTSTILILRLWKKR